MTPSPDPVPPRRGGSPEWRRLLAGVLAFACGVVLLLNGWTAHAGAAAAERFVAGLTARGDAAVEAWLWQIEPAPPTLASDTPPRHQARARLGVRLALPIADGGTAAVELRATGDPEPVEGWPWGGSLPLERILGLAPADAAGGPRLELVAPADWLAGLGARPAADWPLAAVAGGAAPAPGSELDALRLEIDRPLEALARLWMRPEGNRPIRLHFDPEAPGTALPATTLGSGWAQRFLWSTSFLLVAGGLGTALLGRGLAGLAPRLGWGLRLALTLLLALATPLWAPPLEALLAGAGPVGEQAAHLAGSRASWGLRGPVRLATPAEREGERLVVDLPGSRYADALAPFHFRRPVAVARTSDTAWREVTAQIAAQTAALPDTVLGELFDEVAAQLAENRREIAPAFLAPAAALAEDPARPAAVRDGARRLLRLALDPANAPRAGDFAAREKLAAVAALAAHPDQEIAAAAHALSAPHRP